MAGKLVD